MVCNSVCIKYLIASLSLDATSKIAKLCRKKFCSSNCCWCTECFLLKTTHCLRGCPKDACRAQCVDPILNKSCYTLCWLLGASADCDYKNQHKPLHTPWASSSLVIFNCLWLSRPYVQLLKICTLIIYNPCSPIFGQNSNVKVVLPSTFENSKSAL